MAWYTWRMRLFPRRAYLGYRFVSRGRKDYPFVLLCFEAHTKGIHVPTDGNHASFTLPSASCLVHLSQRLKSTIVIKDHLSINNLPFQFLLQNLLMDFDETRYGWSTHGPLQVLFWPALPRDPQCLENKSRGPHLWHNIIMVFVITQQTDIQLARLQTLVDIFHIAYYIHMDWHRHSCLQVNHNLLQTEDLQQWIKCIAVI